MQGGQRICREIIVARFLLTDYTPRNTIKEILWALDRQNIIHLTGKVQCPQCQNIWEVILGDSHRLVIKIDATHPRPKPEEIVSTTKYSNKITLKEIIKQLEETIGKKISTENIIKRAEKNGLTKEEVEDVIEQLKKQGDVFEVERGFIQRIDAE